jgi:hypothetical protein
MTEQSYIYPWRRSFAFLPTRMSLGSRRWVWLRSYEERYRGSAWWEDYYDTRDIGDLLSDPFFEEAIVFAVSREVAGAEAAYFDGAIRTGVKAALDGYRKP